MLGYFAVAQDRLAERSNPEANAWQLAYWKTPIAPQGPPPADHLPQSHGLLPSDCGKCHIAQYRDWSASLHSKAMGPGIAGQFPRMNFNGESECLSCHAPLSEQWAKLKNSSGAWVTNSKFDPKLKSNGLTCAACHLRKRQRNGPPLAEGRVSVSQAVHGEPERTPFFESSEFCKGCHQHSMSTLLINGKPIENTYREWLQSPYADQGVTCQSCHMPKRAHLWRGIHDKEMTRKGVTITTSISPQRLVRGEKIRATLTLQNTGTGHAFPTYTTPAVFMRAAFLDKSGAVLGGDNFVEKILQRRLNMSVTPWQEYFDTRVLPGKQAALEFSRQVPQAAEWLYLWVWVEPDHFYAGFFRSRLRNGAGFAGGAQLQEALNKTTERRYLLYSKKIAISSTGAAD